MYKSGLIIHGSIHSDISRSDEPLYSKWDQYLLSKYNYIKWINKSLGECASLYLICANHTNI